MSVYKPLSRLFLRRYTTTSALRNGWSTGPAPPRLPKEEQEIFERLQRQSTGAFSTPRTEASRISSSSSSPTQETSAPTSTTSPISPSTSPQLNQSPQSSPTTEATLNARIDARGDGEELHPHVRRGAKPEFEGERNPKTGEMGGPKNEPLRWGASGDWSFNGRVTDF